MRSVAAVTGHAIDDPALSTLSGDARFTVAETPPNILVHLTQLALSHGLRCDSWFAGSGLTREQLNDPTLRVSYRQARSVIQRALRTTGDGGLGLAVGQGETLGSFGLLGLAMMTSATFGEAMRVGIVHHRVSGSLMDVSFEEIGPREVALAAWPRFNDAPLLPFLCEELFGSAMAIARELLGSPFRLNRLEVTYPRPAYADAYADYFQCELVFGARYNRVILDVQWLQQPLPAHNPLTAQQALALCNQQYDANGAQPEIVASVERLLRSHLRQQPRLPDVARMLNMSERSLRRRLAEGGRIFREIHDRVRAERALELLHGGTLSVAEIGQEIGFSDPREFRRAFKRWTGMPPRSARQQAA
ncbi:AraC family transcriptional regulator [Dyella solisilvae]|uniref:AraC family transcriptional regulator n=1 Tax=Dyella solisilvae TaxID=1920168 RepID=A0A370K9C3_9GAMM|nr:AraC family transcriptional regulator [Dyella solisilvae]RDI98640.1 AraC family transcriptional regulator [Dyella solisilvae]